MPPTKRSRAKKPTPTKPQAKEKNQSPSEEQARGGRKIGKQKDVLSPYKPVHRPLQAAELDQNAAEEKRQAELAAERKAHNDRTGDASRASWG